MNKSAYKLRGFGPLYIINLDDQPERMEWMANQLRRVGDRKTILASLHMTVDHQQVDDLSDIITGKYPESVTPGEIGCVTSHLKALETLCRGDRSSLCYHHGR